MTREAHRRRGFSRRTQYSLFAGYVVAASGVLIGLGLLLLQRMDPQMLAAVRGVVLDVTAPVVGAGRSVVRGLSGVEQDVSAYIAAGSQNRALREELRTARRLIIHARGIEYENERLKRLAGLAATVDRPVAVARLVGSDPTGTRRYATLAAGASDGVRPGMPVRAADGLVGLVHEVGRHAARILLIIDGGSTVPVRVARNGIPALASGRGDGAIDLHAVIGGGTPFVKGDLVVTSGTGGVFPPGIPVGLVDRADRDAAVASPVADAARLDFAMVLPVFQPPPPAPVVQGPSPR